MFFSSTPTIMTKRQWVQVDRLMKEVVQNVTEDIDPFLALPFISWLNGFPEW